jgi:hypothetical protein
MSNGALRLGHVSPIHSITESKSPIERLPRELTADMCLPCIPDYMECRQTVDTGDATSHFFATVCLNVEEIGNHILLSVIADCI